MLERQRKYHAPGGLNEQQQRERAENGNGDDDVMDTDEAAFLESMRKYMAPGGLYQQQQERNSKNGQKLTIPPMNRRHHFSLNLSFFMHRDFSHIIDKCISNKSYGARRHNIGYIGKTQNKSGRLNIFRSTHRITSFH